MMPNVLKMTFLTCLVSSTHATLSTSLRDAGATGWGDLRMDVSASVSDDARPLAASRYHRSLLDSLHGAKPVHMHPLLPGAFGEAAMHNLTAFRHALLEEILGNSLRGHTMEVCEPERGWRHDRHTMEV